MSGNNAYTHDDVGALRQALFGRSVIRVEQVEQRWGGEEVGFAPLEGKVYLDDGSILKLAGNNGGCSCGAGDYSLTQLNQMPINGITNVEVVDDTKTEGEGITYSIFVLAQDERIELATFEGDDGNGYYGTGFRFAIEAP